VFLFFSIQKHFSEGDYYVYYFMIKGYQQTKTFTLMPEIPFHKKGKKGYISIIPLHLILADQLLGCSWHSLLDNISARNCIQAGRPIREGEGLYVKKKRSICALLEFTACGHSGVQKGNMSPNTTQNV
jgi:hypothetical protein